MNNLGEYFNKQPPDSLFRYRSIDRADKEIRNHYIYLASPRSFNDPFDSCYSISGADDVVRDILREQGFSGNDYLADLICSDLNQTKKGELLILQEKIKVCCFSERKDSLSMWTHYASEHRDICIEYDVSKLIQKSLRPYPILYTRKMQSRPFLNGGGVTSKDIFLACLNKSKEYGADKEWRIIKTNTDVNEFDVDGCIKAVYLGARYFHDRVEDDNDYVKIKLDGLVNFCIDSEIPVHRMMVNFFEYSLFTSPIYDPQNLSETRLGKSNYDSFFANKIKR